MKYKKNRLNAFQYNAESNLFALLNLIKNSLSLPFLNNFHIITLFYLLDKASLKNTVTKHYSRKLGKFFYYTFILHDIYLITFKGEFQNTLFSFRTIFA